MNAAARIRPEVSEAIVAVGAALALAYALHRDAPAALALAASAAAAFVVTRPRLGPVALGVSIPVVYDVTGGSLGVHVAPSDLVLAILFAQLVLAAAAAPALAALRALRPLAPALLPYCAALLVLAAAHPGKLTAINTLQRYELFVVPLLVGAAIAFREFEVRVLKAYVIATTVLAAVWPFASFGMQKNPIGQMIANALLLLIAVRPLRRLVLCAPVLVAGLLLTESRGAVLAALVGTVVVVLLSGSRRQRLVLVRLAPVAIAAVFTFHFLPAGARARLTTFSASTTTTGGYSIGIRREYTLTAERVAHDHPLTGVGIGHYLEGLGTQDATTDPHDVVLLDAAEGGYGLAAALVLLVLGTSAMLWRFRRVRLAAAAAGVVAATFVHGLVDIYWVRGTPVVGWLLVGMVCGVVAREQVARS